MSLNILIVHGTGESSGISAMSADTLQSALKQDWANVKLLEFHPDLFDWLPEHAPGVVMFARPLGTGCDTVDLLQALDIAGWPYVGNPAAAMADAGNAEAAKALLCSAGVAFSDEFFTEHGDNVNLRPRNGLEASQSGRELFVSVLEDPEPRALPIIENPQNHVDAPPRMYFANDQEAYLCPAPLVDSVAYEAQQLAIKVHQLFGFRDASRTTLTLTSKGLTVTAINANPLLSKESLLAIAARAGGYSFEDLAWHLVCNAAARRTGMLEIVSSQTGPAGMLSNFQEHAFIFEGVACRSMEGLLQAVKFEDPNAQKAICNLSGREAKLRGSGQNDVWQANQMLHWSGKSMGREGGDGDYKNFLDRAFQALFSQSEVFREALRLTGQAVLRHSIGERNPRSTVLTEREFVRQLTSLRELC